MKVLRFIFYRPRLLLAVFLIWVEAMYLYYKMYDGFVVTSICLAFYSAFIVFVYSKTVNSQFRLVRKVKLPYSVVRGYLFVFTFFFPIFAILLAIFSKLFLKDHEKQEKFVDKYGNTVTKIHSENPTAIISRGEGENEEHVVVTKFRKLPRKIMYE